MGDKKQYVLAVPNFSEGQDKEKIERIVEPLRHVEGIKLISVEPEEDFNRTVVTFIGDVESVKKALITLGKSSTAEIDLRKHHGSHVRIGAQDTLCVSPLRNVTLDECVDLAREVGEEFFAETGIPVYYSGANACNEDRQAFAYIRKGQFEGLRDLLKATKNDPERQDEYNARKPDLSKDGLLDEKCGATICSAEERGLTAYNVFLNTEDLSIAKAIAKAVRGPSGGFSSIRSAGVKFPEHKGVVVSMNMFDCVQLPIYRLLNFIKAQAAKYGVMVTGTQLVGPVRMEAVISSFVESLSLEDFRESQIIESHLLDD